MMVAEKDSYQLSLFPEASDVDKERVKTNLTEYTKMIKALAGFEKNPPTTDKQFRFQRELKKTVKDLERAVEQILESDVRMVTEYRFIKGNSRAATILRFSSWDYCDKTIDRKITEGIISVANTLLFLE